MSKLTLFIVLSLVFTLWQTKKALTAIGDWHQVNAHAGKGKTPLPVTLYLNPAIWGMAMIACASALAIHGTTVYYANQSYDTFSRMVPVYPGARPVENGFGIAPSLDRKLLILEYVFSDSWKDVADYYASEFISNEWRLKTANDSRMLSLEHRNGNTLYISWSEPARYKEKGLRILKYTFWRRNKVSADQ